jgi:hypothetical protein
MTVLKCWVCRTSSPKHTISFPFVPFAIHRILRSAYITMKSGISVSKITGSYTATYRAISLGMFLISFKRLVAYRAFPYTLSPFSKCCKTPPTTETASRRRCFDRKNDIADFTGFSYLIRRMRYMFLPVKVSL